MLTASPWSYGRTKQMTTSLGKDPESGLQIYRDERNSLGKLLLKARPTAVIGLLQIGSGLLHSTIAIALGQFLFIESQHCRFILQGAYFQSFNL